MSKAKIKLSPPQIKVLAVLSEGRILSRLKDTLSESYSVDGATKLCDERTLFALLKARFIKVRRSFEFIITVNGLDALKRQAVREKIA